LAACVVLSLAAPAAAQAADPTYPAGFRETVAFGGLTFPMDVDFSPDGRIFVAEKSGKIKVFSGPDDRVPSVFADLSEEVYDFWDRGLMSIALDPGFPGNPYVYALYAADLPPGGTPPRWDDDCPSPPGPTDEGCVISGRLSRLEADGDAMTGDEKVLLAGWCQQFPSHSLGDLAFGSEGALYVSGGEGASWEFPDHGQDRGNPCGDPLDEGGALRSQDLLTRSDPTGLSGSILRVNPATGDAWPSNPLILDDEANAQRIIAHGLRNPFRFTFRPGTDELWIGDVGSQFSEEVNRFPVHGGAVVNFGWPCYEGDDVQEPFEAEEVPICEGLYEAPSAVTMPVFTYGEVAPDQNERCEIYNGASISGLAFYEGDGYPGYDGKLFAADYSRECIWTMIPDAGGIPDPSTNRVFASGINGPVDLQIGPGGDLYYVDFDGGAVMRVRHIEDNEPPIAVANAAPTTGGPPLTVNFDAGESEDPDAADPLSYEWDFEDDGTFDSTEVAPSHEYTIRGAYTARLKVTDSLGETDEDTVVIFVDTSPPDASVDGPSAAETWRVGQTIHFQGSASDVEEGTLEASQLSWQLSIEHCNLGGGCHTHQIKSFPGVDEGSFVAPDHEYPSHLVLELTATDSDGLTNSDRVELYPKTVDLSFATDPPGLQLVVGQQNAAPFTRTFIIGGTVAVAAPSPQGDWQFSAWSDLGARTHQFAAPESAATYTATFGRPAAPPPPPPPLPPPPAPPPSPPPAQPKVVRCVVPGVVGRPLSVARTRLARAHCRLGKLRRVYSRLSAGRVVSQRPRAGARLPNGARVTLAVSRGPKKKR